MEVIAAEAKEGADLTSWVISLPQETQPNLEQWYGSYLTKKQRRDYRRARKTYLNSKIEHRAKDTSAFTPIKHSRIIWQQQCRKSGAPLLGFLERWGILFVFDGTLDEFYIDGKLVAFSHSFQAGDTYQWLNYFSLDQATRCGIYYYCTLNNVNRALKDPSVRIICAATGTDHAKKLLGYVGMSSSKVSLEEIQMMYGCRQSLFFTQVKQTKPLWVCRDENVWQ